MAEKSEEVESENYLLNLIFAVAAVVLVVNTVMVVIAGDLVGMAIYTSTFFVIFMLWAGFNALIKTIKATNKQGE